MAKRSKEENLDGDAAPLAHNPFAALAPDTTPTPKATQSPQTKSSPAQKNETWGSKIVLSREKKGRGGKTVTRVKGLPKTRLEALAKSMKKSLGCGASVDGDDVLLHGSLTERGAEWLRGQGAKRVIVGN